jgi:hypothetical protein
VKKLFNWRKEESIEVRHCSGIIDGVVQQEGGRVVKLGIGLV